VGIVTTTTTTTTMTDPAALLRLLAWLSPAFPVGGFAYSHGLEWAVEAGDVHDGDTLRAWVEDVLRFGSGRTDAILLRHAHRGEDVAALARATAASRERRMEAVAQGAAFVTAAGAWQAPRPDPLPQGEGEARKPVPPASGLGLPYQVAIGTLAGTHGIPEDDTALGYLHAFAANLISAAVRLVPLGQSTGLAVLAALEPALRDVANETASATLDDIGGCAFRSDLAAMRHETQYTRLFRS
jgi:urease accessory protein